MTAARRVLSEVFGFEAFRPGQEAVIEALLAALKRLPVTLFAIDEAHCISQWGPAFRPEYADLCRLSALFPGIPLAALPLARAGGRVAVENGAGGLPHHGYAYAHEGHARFHVPSLAGGPAGLAQSDARGRGGRRGDGRGYGGR